MKKDTIAFIILGKSIEKLKEYSSLMKFTLSFTVVFSCLICFLLVPNNGYSLKMILLLFIAGMLVSGSANAINQAVEKNTDALMKRTAKRPVASGKMSQSEAYTFAFLSAIIGVLILFFYFNLTAALLSAFSLIIYAFVYTPLKKINSIAVLIGAFPGAFPCLIGWAAGFYDDKIMWIGGLILFAIQFLWQFPHFWAIAWVSHQDYTTAGFKLLPSEKGPTKFTALQGIMYSVLMIPVGILPNLFGITGFISLWIILVFNGIMVLQSIRLYNEMNVQAARRVMFTSYIYLPCVFLTMLADKIY